MSEQSETWKAGREAFERGRPCECPKGIKDSIERQQWFSGWIAARTEATLRPILIERGIEFRAS